MAEAEKQLPADLETQLMALGLTNYQARVYRAVFILKECSISQIANLISKKFNIDENRIEFDKSKPTGQFKKTAKSDKKNFEFTSIEEGLNQTIEWFIENYNYIRK